MITTAEINLLKHQEGRFIEQTKKLVNEVDRNTGRLSSFYEKSDARLTYNIPFTKENVDKYLMSELPLVQTHNITDPNQVKYYGKCEHIDTGNMPYRDGTYNYEQFILRSWKDFCNLTSRPGGPIGRTNYQIKQEPNHSHIG
jgi:hypothetical protein